MRICAEPCRLPILAVGAGRRVLQARATVVRPRCGAVHKSVPVTRFTCCDR
jgi:hypothetical protein